jgi:radical SAM protein with 4Fe4S-binding SPASM domain
MKFKQFLNIPFAAVFAYKSIKETDLCNYGDKKTFLKKQFNKLFEYYKTIINNGKIINCFSITNILGILKNRVKRFISCNGGRTLFSITANGNIFACEHLVYDKKYAIGDIKSGIKNISNMTAPNVEIISNCQNCWVKYLCCGGCFSSKIETGRNNMSMSEDDCFIHKLHYEFIIRLYNEIEIIKENNEDN